MTDPVARDRLHVENARVGRWEAGSMMTPRDKLAALLHEEAFGCADHEGDDPDVARETHLDHADRLLAAGVSANPVEVSGGLAAPGLDVERLARAMLNLDPPWDENGRDERDTREFARDLAAEYAALTETPGERE